MSHKKRNTIKIVEDISICIVLSFLFYSCLTYTQRIEKYHSLVVANKYKEALKEIDRIKWLKNPRNTFLYLAEKGLALRLAGDYDSSNACFERADIISQEYGKKAGEVAKSYLLNPMMEKYRGQEFEKFLIHYYKAVNYIDLGKIDDALVEVRRLTLTSNRLKDKRGNSSKKYDDDAFSHFAQGLLYERVKNPNDAFIAYRNALDIFYEKNNLWYGISTPQLLVDAFYRTGKAMGFYDELNYYQKKMQLRFPSDEETKNSYLYVFIESGLSPRRLEEKLFFSHTQTNGNQLVFEQAGVIAATSYAYALPSSYIEYSKFLSYITSLAVSIPYYEPSIPIYDSFSYPNKNTVVNPILDVNELAIQTLSEQKTEIILAALGRATIRILLKIAATQGINSTGDRNSEVFSALARGLIDIASLSVEKADTRNWQSLPSKIYCMRIPLSRGENSIVIQGSSMRNSAAKERTITLNVYNDNSIPVQIKSIRFL